MMKLFLKVLLVASGLLALQVQCEETLHSILHNVRVKYDLPSIAAAVIEGNHIIASEAVGYRIINDTTVPVTLNDKYHLGSDTKAFTSRVIGQLIEEGLLSSWDACLGDVFHGEVELVPSFESMTLRELASHTSGLPGDSDNDAMDALVNKATFLPGNLGEQRLALLEMAQTSVVINLEARGTFAYSNLGYILLGIVIEHVTCQEYEFVVRERVFEPLGMTTAGFGCQATLGRVNAPMPHTRNGNNTKVYYAGPNCDNPVIMGPAGTAHMSIGDFATWALFNMKNDSLTNLLQTPVVSMQVKDPRPGTPPSGKYALGWGLVQMPFSVDPLIFHGGSNEKNLAYIVLDKKGSFALVMTTNLGGDDAQAGLQEAVSNVFHAFQ